MGDQYSEAAVKLGQYIAPALDREITDEDYPLFDLLLDFAKDKIFAQGYPFGNRPDELPSQYQSLQIRIAAFSVPLRGVSQIFRKGGCP